MTNRPVKFALVASALAWLLSNAWADFSSANWQFRHPIRIESTAAIATVKIDPIVYRGSAARLADLRVLRDSVERPYVLETLRGTANETELQPRIVNKAVVPNAGLELTLDLGAPAAHNRLRVTTPERNSSERDSIYHNFKQRVRIETSNDDRHWAVAREDGYIFDFSQDDRRVSVLSIDYPVSTRRYVRATIFGWKDPKFVEGALLTHWMERPDTREGYAVFNQPVAVQEPKTQSTVYTIDLGFEGLPHDQMELNVAPALFYRAIEIETSKDGKEWTYAGQGVIYRTPEQQRLDASFGEVWDRYLRFRIMNRDDQPLAVTKVAVKTIVRQVKFQTGGAGQYWLAYGNADGKTPAYDLSFVIPKNVVAASPAALGLRRGASNGHMVSPRATLAWMRAAQARAILGGREFVTVEDLLDMAPDVLRHRLWMSAPEVRDRLRHIDGRGAAGQRR